MSWLEAGARSATVLVPTALLDTQAWSHSWHHLHLALHPMHSWQHCFLQERQLHRLPGAGRCLHLQRHWHRRRPMTAWHEKANRVKQNSMNQNCYGHNDGEYETERNRRPDDYDDEGDEDAGAYYLVLALLLF